MATYQRTAQQRKLDKERSEGYEHFVSSQITRPLLTRFNAKDDLDIYAPGWYIEIKEKHSKMTARWPLPEGCEERNAFIVDELSIRRAMRHYPQVFFLLRDNVDKENPRLFIVPIWEMITLPKKRVNREGNTGHKKGKWIVDLSLCTRLSHEDQAQEYCEHAMVNTPWLNSECLGMGVKNV